MRKMLAIFTVIASLAFAVTAVSCDVGVDEEKVVFKGGTTTYDFADYGIKELISVTSSNTSVLSFKCNPPDTKTTMTVSKPGTTQVTIKGKMYDDKTLTQVEEYTITSTGGVSGKVISTKSE